MEMGRGEIRQNLHKKKMERSFGIFVLGMFFVR